ncbi:MAG: HD domain-containing phosphohydrolase [Pseudomonadota bacterium]
MLSSAEADRLRAYEAPSRVVAVIDPDPRLRDAMSKLLWPLYRALDCADVETAVGRCSRPPAAVLIGEAVQGAGGRGAIQYLRGQPAFAGVPIVLLAASASSRPRAADDGPDMVVPPPHAGRVILDAVARLGNRAVEAGWERLPEAPRQALKRSLSVFSTLPQLMGNGEPLAYEDVASACAPVIDAVKEQGQRYIFEGLSNHNALHFVHSLRVSTLLALFGHTIGLDDTSLMTLASAGLVHDIGKTVLPDDVMNKVGALDQREEQIAHSHVDATVRYLEKHSDVPKAVITIAGEHHERMDGTGYPRQLKGEQINDLSRMAAIVDVFCALTERRPHRAAMGPFQALEVMQENVREKLDQHLVRMFSGMLVKAAA